ncbi:hypothetical protein [Aerosakkonema funiforme]|uniref:hypothetical protein n=1 Tax=Aerosakkonema funiforme TaxID=1246630 RepID=UPI0035BB7F28
MSTNNGQTPADTQTKERIEEVIRNAQNVRNTQNTQNTQNKKAKKPKYEEPEEEESLSTQLGTQCAEIAQQLLEADKSATEARIKAGIVKGLQEIGDINTGIQIGHLLGLKRAVGKSATKITTDLLKLQELSASEIKLDQLIEKFMLPEGQETKDPLVLETELHLKAIRFLPSKTDFGIFEN